jgi:hypothetical protein
MSKKYQDFVQNDDKVLDVWYSLIGEKGVVRINVPEVTAEQLREQADFLFDIGRDLANVTDEDDISICIGTTVSFFIFQGKDAKGDDIGIESPSLDRRLLLQLEDFEVREIISELFYDREAYEPTSSHVLSEDEISKLINPFGQNSNQ